ncbi:MAG: RNA polymerase sigma factor [Deltaproteobacteria bacterium]|nr:RNA polymerase sigma factor [Deltaproteobacteria bacterium]
MSFDVADLYRRYGDLVLGRCRTLLRNDAEAHDACQEIFLRMHRYRDRFREEAAPSTYLFHVTTTTCLNRLRTRRRHPEDPLAHPPDMARVASNDTLLDDLALKDLVERLLAQADERTRLCLLYHYADGMTCEEVGTLLGITGAAVRKRISVFRESLATSPPPWLPERLS